MQRVVKQAPYIGFGVAFIIFAAVGVYAVISLNEFIDSRHTVTQTLHIKDQLGSILSLATDLETGMRGYVITGDQAFLEPYLAASGPDGLSFQLQQLEDQLSNDPPQLARLQTLKGLVSQRLGQVEQVVIVRRTQGFETARDIVALGNGKATMDAIRSSLNEIGTELDAQLEARTRMEDLQGQRLITALTSGGLLIVLLLVLGIVLLTRESARRTQAESNLRRFNEQLEEAIQQRTSDVEQTNAALKAEMAERERAEKALGLAELRFTKAFQTVPTALIITRMQDGQILDANYSFLSLSGYTRDEVLGRTTIDLGLLQKKYRDEIVTVLQNQSGSIRDRELTIFTKQGEPRQVLFSLERMDLDQGAYLLTILYDVTHRKQAEEKLSHQALLLQNVSDAIVGADFDYKIIAWNAGAETLYGWTAEEVLGKSVETILQTDYVNTGISEVIEHFVKDGTWKGEVTQKRKDGSSLIIQASVSLVKDTDGNQIGSIAINRDITEWVRADSALRQSLERYDTTLDNMLEGCQIIDDEWRYIYINEAAAFQGRHLREQLLGHTMMEMYPGIEQSEFFGMMRHCKATQTPARMENEFQFPDGSLGWFELSIQPVPEGIFILSIDMSERKRSQAKLQQKLQYLNALRKIDIAIMASTELSMSLNTVLDNVTRELGVHAAAVLLLNPYIQTLEFASGRGFKFHTIEQTRMRLGQGYAGKAALERKMQHLASLPDANPPFLRSQLLVEEKFVEYYATPLIARGAVVGVLEVFHRESLEADADWLEFMETLAGQAAIAVDNFKLYEGLQRSNVDLILAYDATIEGWSHALDLRDKETEGHTQRVTEMTLLLARAMNISDADLVHIRRGALLHDIGKMGVPDGILLKPDKLSNEEWALMKMHPQYAYEMLAPIAYLGPALDIPYCHHEKWDGSGYPRGLVGEQIPLAARIFAVVDVWDALRSDRPYREGWPDSRVREHIKADAGSHFDPQVVEAFLQLQARG